MRGHDLVEGATRDAHDPKKRRWYHGTREEFSSGDLIRPMRPDDRGEWGGATTFVYLTPDPDAAIWEAELAQGEGPGRVYSVEPLGPIEDLTDATDRTASGHPSMTWRTREPLWVRAEVKEWPLYHGTRADLRVGDLIRPGHVANFGSGPRTANHVYAAQTLDAAKWGAELAAGDGPGRIYIVEPTGPTENDPNLTNKKFRGNPTKSFRSRHPMRVVGEVAEWEGHPVEAVTAMRERLATLERQGGAEIDD